MHIEKFSITNFKKQLSEIATDVEKIEFISDKVTKCKDAIQDVKHEAANFETMEIKLNVKAARQEILLVELVNSDRKIRRSVKRKLMKLCAKKLVNEFNDYLERIEVLLAHYRTKLEAIAIWNECFKNEKEITKINDSINRIVWKRGEAKLLRLFDCLQSNGGVAKFSKEEILVHFVDEKQIPFSRRNNYTRKINWLKSDSSFSIFVDELAQRKAIDEENKYKVFEKHFCNRNGKPFKYLAQKKNNTINYTETVKWIRQILNSIEIVIVFIVSRSYFMFYDTLGENMKSISDYIIT